VVEADADRPWLAADRSPARSMICTWRFRAGSRSFVLVVDPGALYQLRGRW